MKLTITTFLLATLLNIFCPASFAGSIPFGVYAGGLQGTFAPEQSFSITGMQGTFEGGYQWNMTSTMLSAGVLSRYSEFSYNTSEIKKNARWYYAGLYVAGTVLMTDTWELRLKGASAFQSKLFVFATTEGIVNGGNQQTNDYSLYEGGVGTEFTLAIVKRLLGKKKFDPVMRLGFEVGNLNQTFTKKQQRIVVTRADDNNSEASAATNGTYRLNVLIASLTLGVEL